MARTITSLTLIVCTYKRPLFFRRCIESVSRLSVPDGFSLTLAIADNNPQSERDGYVAAGLRQITWPFVYGHQPQPGYSNARNLGLELALSTRSEVFAFVDDDLVLDAGWLLGQLETYRSFDCDAVGGAVIGLQKVPPHGSVQRDSSMANFSFIRAFADPGGLGLRFDPAMNLTGFEDIQFSSQASDCGQRIVCSDFPAVYDPSSSGATADDEQINRAMVAIAMARNRIVRLRQDGKPGLAALQSLASLHYGLKSGGLLLESLMHRSLGNPIKGRAKSVEAWKEFGKSTATLAGLSGGFIARQDVRRGR